MTDINGHDEFAELEQRRLEIMDDAVVTRGVTLDLLDEQKDLFRYFRSVGPLMDNPDLHGISLSEIRSKEDRLDKVNRMLGTLSVNGTETTE